MVVVHGQVELRIMQLGCYSIFGFANRDSQLRKHFPNPNSGKIPRHGKFFVFMHAIKTLKRQIMNKHKIRGV